jgi:hypothetical protein
VFCPKCSQPQVSDEIRFCSRCGFPLNSVATLLKNEGVLPEPTKTPSSRSRVATESLVLLIFSWALGLLLTYWFDVGGPFEFLAKAGAGLFLCVGLIGLLRFLYAFLFLKSETHQQKNSPVTVVSSLKDPDNRSLPPAAINPLADWQRPVNTRDMSTPATVTENTTRLLDES